MVIASLTGVVEVMRKGWVPAVMANGRIVALLREGQKLVFGDAEEVAWRLMVLGGFISLNTGYAHDLPDDLRREIVAVIEHFVEWCEITHERVTQQGVRDEEYTLYCQLDNELSALARDRVSRQQPRICLDVSDAFYRDVGALRDDAQSTDASLLGPPARDDAFGEIGRHARE